MALADPRWLRRAGREALVGLAYVLLTLGVTWPLASHFGQAIPGGSTAADNWQFYWNIWWVRRALLELHASPWVTREVFHPDGALLYFHTLHLVPSVMVLPLVGALGLVAAYNATIVMAFVLCAYGTYRLVLELMPADGATFAPRHMAAFTAGTAFSFASYHSMRLTGQLNLLSAQWVPFYALFLWRAWRRPSPGAVLGAAAFFALGALTDWQYALFLSLFTAVFVAWHLVADRGRPGLARRTAAVVGALTLAAVVLSPVLVPALRAGRTAFRVADPYASSIEMSASLLSYAWPGPLHPLWRPGMPVLGAAGVFPGYVLLMLAAAAVLGRWPPARFWITCGAVFLLLSLGPVLHVAREPLALLGATVPLPYAALHRLPYADLFRAPARFALMADLCLAVLAGAGSLLLVQRARAVSPALVFALVNALLLAENRPLRYLPARPQAPPFYASLGGVADRRALLEVPIAEHAFEDADRMLYQTVHGRPIFGGYLSRGRTALPLDALPGFAELGFARVPVNDVVSYEPAARPRIARKLLALLGTGRVVLDRTRLGPVGTRRARTVAESLLGLPVYEDGNTVAFAVPEESAAPAFLALGGGWSALHEGAGGQGEARWRWMGQAARVGVFAPEAARYEVVLRGWSAERPRRLAVALDGRPLSVIAVDARPSSMRVAAEDLAPGWHWIELRSLDGVVRGAGEPRETAVAAAELALRRAP